MRQTQYNYQLCGIICLIILLNEINYSFLNIKNYVSYIWDKIDFFLTLQNFAPKEYLLKYLYYFISKFRIQFEPYVNLTIYKILEFIDNKNLNIRKKALNVLMLLVRFYPNDIKPIKLSIIKLLKILQNDKDENIRNKSIHIYNEIQKHFSISSKSSINNEQKNKKHKLYFYDLGNSNEYFNNNILESNIENNNRIYNKGLVIRKPLYISNIYSRNRSFNKNGLKDNYIRQFSNKSVQNRSFMHKNNILNIKENNRYGQNMSNSINNNYYTENEIGFRDLLSFFKKKSDNKYKMNNNFYNLREDVKKNNNGLLQIRKIKSEKKIKTC